VCAHVVCCFLQCDIEEYLNRATAGGGDQDRMLAVVNEPETLLRLVSRATSFSCSLGSAMKKVRTRNYTTITVSITLYTTITASITLLQRYMVCCRVSIVTDVYV
jgi:hypothetical protein